MWHLRSYGWYSITRGTAIINYIVGYMHYTSYNNVWDRPSLHWYFIVTTTWLDCYRWLIPITLLCLFPLLLKWFYIRDIRKHLAAFRSKSNCLFSWEIPCSISYINTIEHGLPVLLTNLVNLPPYPITLAYITSLNFVTDYVETRLIRWEYLRDLGRQVGWRLKIIFGKATPTDLNHLHQL